MLKAKHIITLMLCVASFGALRADIVKSPEDMALAHEKRLASMCGMLTPPEITCVHDNGVIALPTWYNSDFPQPFVDGLASTNKFGITVWPVSVVVDALTGDTLFLNANNQLIHTVAATDFSPDWIARLKYGDNPPLDPLLAVDKVESRWTFVDQYYMAAYLAAKNAASYPPVTPPPGGGTSQMGVPGLQIAGFNISGGGSEFSLALSGDDIAEFPHSKFHVLFSPDLTSKQWRKVLEEVVPDIPAGSSTQYLLTSDDIFGEDAPFAIAHDPVNCVATTNTVVSSIDPNVTYSHVSCDCAASSSANSSGFFQLVSDSSSTGLIPDWWLNLHGVNLSDIWTVVYANGIGMNFVEMYANNLIPVYDPNANGGAGGWTFASGGNYDGWWNVFYPLMIFSRFRSTYSAITRHGT
ncbi:MAG: hypothetical protein FWG05_02880 [Kiritimatiellaeota bacterium]|nr:hypothetical protein [Kiritimatiellota bacterium]